MLVLARKVGEKIVIGKDIEVTVLAIKGDQVRLGIEAPDNVSIHRQEIFLEIEAENKRAARSKKPLSLAQLWEQRNK